MTITEAMIEQTLDTSKKPQEKDTDVLKKISTALQWFWHWFMHIISWIKNNKEKVKLFIPIAIGSVCIMLFLAVRLYLNMRELNTQSLELYALSHFWYTSLQESMYTKEDVQSLSKVKDLITYDASLTEEKQRYENYLSTLQYPYTHFLQYIYLPRLNIRKDPYTDTIDTDLIGLKFLQNDPYNDITLIEKRTNFFKHVGENNEYNNISNISVGTIVENKSWFFHIPITVSFTSPSKRSFLLLVDKLSLMSNKDNIALINEFMYYLRDEIKTDKTDMIKKLKATYNEKWDDDKVIWYHLYNRTKGIEKNQLVDADMIQKVIKEVVACEEDTPQKNCYYIFRDKYRGIPTLAYTIGNEKANNKVEQLKVFLTWLPPVMSIKEFSFDRNREQQIITAEKIEYKGKIWLEIYGKGISEQEITDIGTLLGKQCFNTNTILNPTTSLQKIDESLLQISDVNKLDTTRTKHLWELKDIIQEVVDSYPKFTNYQKTVKLFELYRMLRDANICKA
jgi:hypothetical protein